MEDASGGKHRVLRGCIVAVVVTALMLAGRLLLDKTLGDSSTVAWAVVPIVLAAWYGGIWGGLLAMVLGLILGLHFFMLRGDWRIPDAGDQLRIFVYLFAGTMLSLLFELLHRARAQLQQRNRQLTAELAERRRSEAVAQAESMRVRAAEEALRQSELRYRMAAEAANDVIWDWDPAAGHVLLGERMVTVFGYPAGEIGGAQEWWTERVHPEDRAHFLRALREALAGETDRYSIEYRFRRADGRYVPAQSHACILRDAEGKPARVIGTLVDLSPLKKAEAATAHFQALFEASPACHLVLDPQLVIIGASDNLLKATMKTRAEIVGRFLFDVFPDDPTDPGADGTRNWRASLERVRSERTTDVMGLQRFPVARPPEAGGGFEERYWSALNSPILGADGELAFIVHRTEDITDYVRAHGETAQATLETRERQLEADIFLRAQELAEANRRIKAQNEHLRVLADSVAEANERLSFAMELDDAAQNQSDSEALMLTVAKRICRRLGAQRFAWFEVDEDGDRYHIHGDFNDGVPSRKGYHRLSTYGARVQTSLAAGEVFVCDDTQAPDAGGLHAPAFRAADVGAVIVVPLLRNGRLSGGVTLHSKTARAWTQAEIATMELLAQRSWETLERANIARALKDSNERLQFMADLSEVLEPLSDPQEMMDAVMRHIGTRLAAHRCAWAEFDEDENHYRVMGNYLDGLPSRVGRFRLDAFGDEPLRRAREGLTLRCDDTESGTDLGIDAAAAREAGYRAFIFVPLRKDGRLIAALAVHHIPPRRWQDREVELLELATQRSWESIERSRNLRDLCASREELRQADRIKDQFLATLAHELRGPLAPMSNALQLLRTAADEHGRDRARQIMKRQLAHLVRLVDDLLDVGRIRSGKLELHPRWTELDEVVRSALEIADPLIRAGQHRIKVQLPPQLVRVLVDPARLAQALANLLSNSARYTPSGGHIALDVSLADGALEIAVEDDGVGISAEAMPRVFELFAQIDSSGGRAQGGLGVGLSLVKNMMEMHGGSVTARSEGPGRGSCFTLRLPADKVSCDAQPAPAQTAAGSGQGSSRPAAAVSRRIVVADDNADSAETTAALLALLGHDVKTASDGLAAVQLAERLRPDVMVMDIGMPHMNGLDAAREIRKRPWGRKLILIALSGWGQEEDRRQSTEAGFDFHLVKPVELASLERMLAAAPAAAKPEPAALVG